MFHVERACFMRLNSPNRTGASSALLRRESALCLGISAMLHVPTAHAAINKCTGADGKVVFSDHPCANSQASATVKAAPKAPTGAKAGATGGAASSAKMRRLDAVTPKTSIAKRKNPQVIDAQCVAEGRVIEQQRAKQNIVDEAQRKAFAQVEASFAKNCTYE